MILIFFFYDTTQQKSIPVSNSHILFKFILKEYFFRNIFIFKQRSIRPEGKTNRSTSETFPFLRCQRGTTGTTNIIFNKKSSSFTSTADIPNPRCFITTQKTIIHSLYINHKLNTQFMVLPIQIYKIFFQLSNFLNASIGVKLLISMDFISSITTSESLNRKLSGSFTFSGIFKS